MDANIIIAFVTLFGVLCTALVGWLNASRDRRERIRLASMEETRAKELAVLKASLDERLALGAAQHAQSLTLLRQSLELQKKAQEQRGARFVAANTRRVECLESLYEASGETLAAIHDLLQPMQPAFACEEDRAGHMIRLVERITTSQNTLRMTLRRWDFYLTEDLADRWTKFLKDTELLLLKWEHAQKSLDHTQNTLDMLDAWQSLNSEFVEARKTLAAKLRVLLGLEEENRVSEPDPVGP